MPIYEYTCTGCAKRVEVFQRSRRTETALPPPCPACGRRRLRPLMSRFAFASEEEWAGFDGMEDLDSDDPEAVQAWAGGRAAATGVPDARQGADDTLDLGDDA